MLGPLRIVSESSNNVRMAHLCTHVDHYASTYGDKGWGCGYRYEIFLLSSTFFYFLLIINQLILISCITIYCYFYRNIQIMLSSLQHHTGYYSRLFTGPNTMPSISKIQSLIEKAWRKGFDLQVIILLIYKIYYSKQCLFFEKVFHVRQKI